LTKDRLQVSASSVWILSPTVMLMDDNRKATLNARGRKLQRDAHGNILTRDSTKQQQKDQKELQNFLGLLNFFYKKVMRDPSIWKKEDLQSSRAFVQHVLENQEDFPLDSTVIIESLIPSSNQQYKQNQVETLLTDGFVQSITNKSWSYGDGVDEPVVQVLHTDNIKFGTFSSHYDKVKIVCLTVVDRKGHRLLARAAAHDRI